MLVLALVSARLGFDLVGLGMQGCLGIMLGWLDALGLGMVAWRRPSRSSCSSTRAPKRHDRKQRRRASSICASRTRATRTVR